jgi:hypothetical protein
MESRFNWRTSSWLWANWALSMALASFVAASTQAVLWFSSGIWDPDEVKIYLNTPPLARLSTSLIGGVMAGAVLAFFVGAFQITTFKQNARTVILSVLGVVAGTVLCCAASATGPSQVESELSINLRLGVVSGGIAGALAGLYQWALLRKRLSGLGGWIPVTVACWAAGTAIAYGLTKAQASETLTEWLIFLLAATAGGAILGAGQWLLLRRSLNRALWWIPASALAWALAVPLSKFMPLYSFPPGVIGGVVMGGVLVWMMKAKPDTAGAKGF